MYAPYMYGPAGSRSEQHRIANPDVRPKYAVRTKGKKVSKKELISNIREEFQDLLKLDTFTALNWSIKPPNAKISKNNAWLSMWTDDGKKFDDVVLSHFYFDTKTHRLYCFDNKGETKYYLKANNAYFNPKFPTQRWDEVMNIVEGHLQNICEV